MPSLLSRYQHDVHAAASSPASLTLPLALLIASVLAGVGTFNRHALLTSAIAWLAIAISSTLKVGAASLAHATYPQRLAWTAGALMALAQLCERAMDGRGIWWAKALLPLAIYALAKAGILGDPLPGPDDPPSSPTKSGPLPTHGSHSVLLIATASGVTAIYTTSGSISSIALGLSYVVLEVLAFHLVEQTKHHVHTGTAVIYSTNGLLTQPSKPVTSDLEQWISVLRDVSVSGTVVTGLGAVGLESRSFGGLVFISPIGKVMGGSWVFLHTVLSVAYTLGILVIYITLFSALILMLQRQGAFLTSFIPFSAAVLSQLLLAFSFSRFWFAVLAAGAAFAFLDEQDTFAAGSRMRLRFGKILTLVAALSFSALTFYHVQHTSGIVISPYDLETSSPMVPLSPLQQTDKSIHPINELVLNARSSWNSQLQSQSQTLEAAVTEYKRRYGIPPPPHFDRWFDFAKRNGVKMIDDYDSIYHSLLPFWALKPATIRARTREALGYGDNQLLGLLIRGGKAVHVEAGPEWQQQAMVGMIGKFVEYIPDMDLAFNIHDEPRVVVPHDELSRLIQIALTQNLPAANAQPTPRNAFSSPPKDMTSGNRITEVKTTRFSHYPHQATWLPSRLSCSPDSPARALDDSHPRDNRTAYAVGELGFIYNQTAFSDICNSPSFSSSFGFFDRPNAFNVVHQLFPIFSQSKISSYQDILYPSPWYWYGKVKYQSSQDSSWPEKQNRLWWRGSTTGGFSRAGGWKRQHRQHFVRKVNGLDTAQIMGRGRAGVADDTHFSADWTVRDVARPDFRDLVDVHFSHVGQCDPGDCDAQREFFDVVEPADQQEAWRYRYLLDLDGNAFSGRFYAFLQSRSLPFKMAVFREWHEDWIRPWVHYVPLSLDADEALEAVRYLDAEDEGRELATGMADAGREWAGQALRNEDFEAWLFRLLLEYGRVIDDNRASIGYVGA